MSADHLIDAAKNVLKNDLEEDAMRPSKFDVLDFFRSWLKTKLIVAGMGLVFLVILWLMFASFGLFL